MTSKTATRSINRIDFGKGVFDGPRQVNFSASSSERRAVLILRGFCGFLSILMTPVNPGTCQT